jgi:uncharacterized RDD family membrane protein YckC
VEQSQPPENQPPEDPPQDLPAYPSYPGEVPADGHGAPPPSYSSQPVGGGTRRFATWFERVGAYLVDGIATFALNLLLQLIFGSPLTTTTDQTTNQIHYDFSGSTGAVVYGIGLLWVIFNWIYLQGTTGQTIGKKAVGLAVYRAGSTQPIGAGLAIGRYFARFLDVIPCFLGLLWPLWDAENRTFADMICGTRVYKL